MQVGGLADVVSGLGKACLQRGHKVEVMLPFYECLPEEEITDLQHELDFDAPKVPPMAFPRCLPSFGHGLAYIWFFLPRQKAVSLACMLPDA